MEGYLYSLGIFMNKLWLLLGLMLPLFVKAPAQDWENGFNTDTGGREFYFDPALLQGDQREERASMLAEFPASRYTAYRVDVEVRGVRSDVMQTAIVQYEKDVTPEQTHKLHDIMFRHDNKPCLVVGGTGYWLHYPAEMLTKRESRTIRRLLSRHFNRIKSLDEFEKIEIDL